MVLKITEIIFLKPSVRRWLSSKFSTCCNYCHCYNTNYYYITPPAVGSGVISHPLHSDCVAAATTVFSPWTLALPGPVCCSPAA